jgi:glycosyltransferase involved in cell wall biosynthesis
MTPGKDSPVAISLIVATVGRVEELARLLQSIAVQQMPEVELIVVDQNPDDRVKTLLEDAAPLLRCTHIRSPLGLSRARNAGLAVAMGAIVGFPDDDCWYPEKFLLHVKQWFDIHPAHQLLCCSLRDETGKEVAARWPVYSQRLNRNSALRAAASASLFIRAQAVRQLNGFDEQIGLGSGTLFQSGEDTDLALRCLRAGGNAWFEKFLHVGHPRRDPAGVPPHRGFAYGMGFGYILGKHGYPSRLAAYHVVRAIIGASRSLLRLRATEASFYLQSALGRWKGYAAASRMAKKSVRQDRANGGCLPA